MDRGVIQRYDDERRRREESLSCLLVLILLQYQFKLMQMKEKKKKWIAARGLTFNSVWSLNGCGGKKGDGVRGGQRNEIQR